SFINTGLSAGTTYSYRVYAYNSIGNSALSNTASTTTSANADTIPPVVKIVSPANGSTVTGTVKISGNGIDNVKLQSLKLVIDGATVASTSSTSITYTWNT